MDSDTDRVEVTDDDTVVLQIGWVHVLVVLVVVVGIGGALAAGLWMGRQLNAPATSPASASQQQFPQTQLQQAVPLQSSQSQAPVQIQPAEPSSAGVTTSIGRTPNAGDEAVDFTLKNLEGEKVSLSDFEGQPVLINFWATWCGPCRLEMPVIEQMYQAHKDQGFVVLGVDVEESITIVGSFVKSMELTFPILLDYNGQISNGPYRIRAFPTSYFIGRDGKISAAHRGMMNEQIMQHYMDQVLATQPAEASGQD